MRRGCDTAEGVTVATYQFNNQGYSEFSSDGALAECQGCGYQWRMEVSPEGNTVFYDCPSCQTDTVVKILEPGPNSVR